MDVMMPGRRTVAFFLALALAMPSGLNALLLAAPAPSVRPLWAPLPIDQRAIAALTTPAAPGYVAGTATRGTAAPSPVAAPLTAPSPVPLTAPRLEQSAGTSATSGPCVSPANEIVAENCKPGSPKAEWDLPFASATDSAGDPTIQGFTTEFSVNKTGANGAPSVVQFKVDTTAASYRLDIYRMGYYGGLGARKVATVNVAGTGAQAPCLTDASVGLVDCGNWNASAQWVIPADAVSGIYFAKAVRGDSGGASHIFFVVRDDAGASDLVFQTS